MSKKRQTSEKAQISIIMKFLCSCQHLAEASQLLGVIIASLNTETGNETQPSTVISKRKSVSIVNVMHIWYVQKCSKSRNHFVTFKSTEDPCNIRGICSLLQLNSIRQYHSPNKCRLLVPNSSGLQAFCRNQSILGRANFYKKVTF